jgi:hypothetical protein
LEVEVKTEKERRAAREYYEKNADAIRAKSRQWNADNKERKQATRRAYYAANRERIIEKAKAWEAANPERKRERNRARRYARVYGISIADFDRMMEIQSRACAVCANEFESTSEVHVDHDHATGHVRALLCASCNIGLGVLERDGGIWLARAQAYLAQFKSSSVLKSGLWRAA